VRRTHTLRRAPADNGTERLFHRGNLPGSYSENVDIAYAASVAARSPAFGSYASEIAVTRPPDTGAAPARVPQGSPRARSGGAIAPRLRRYIPPSRVLGTVCDDPGVAGCPRDRQAGSTVCCECQDDDKDNEPDKKQAHDDHESRADQAVARVGLAPAARLVGRWVAHARDGIPRVPRNGAARRTALRQ
jgi:hypothetical protein